MQSALRRGTRLLPVFALLALAGCGRSGYQYIESSDAHYFAKVPDDWTITSDGVVNPSLVGSDGSFSGLPGDDTLPWRTEFVEDETSGDVDHVIGYVGAQPVDAELRDTLDLATLLPFDPAKDDAGYAVVDTKSVTSRDLHGYRLKFTRGTGDTQVLFDRLVLTNESTSVVYVVQFACSSACIDEHASVIDEVMQTFRVERT